VKLADIMRRSVAQIDAAASAQAAYDLMSGLKLRHLVVTSERQVLGVISHRDLGGARGHMIRSGQATGELMPDRDLVVAHPDMEVADAAKLMAKRHIGCLPVFKGKRLMGLVTTTDLLTALAPASRAAHPPKRGSAGRKAPRRSPPNQGRRP
jgi:acetoin utilization protein AcuB